MVVAFKGGVSGRPRRWKSLLRILVLGLVGLELLYLLAANLALSTGLVRHFANEKPEMVLLSYDRAWTVWPGRVHVSGLALRFQDYNVQFLLEVEQAQTDIALTDLLSRKFHATRTRVEGVSWRMLHKLKEASPERFEAFPKIFGFARPAVQDQPEPTERMSQQDIDNQWTVELNDVDGTVREFWLLEYCYEGRGHVTGAFMLKPETRMWLAPSTLTLEGGTLTAGEHVVASKFSMRAEVAIGNYDIPNMPGSMVLGAISGSARIDTELTDVSAANLYLPGLKASGPGTLSMELHLVAGRLIPGTQLDVKLPALHAAYGAARYDGSFNATFRVAAQTQTPVASAVAAGLVTATIEGNRFVTRVSGATGELALTGNDLVPGLALRLLHGEVAEARVEDARPIKALVTSRVPIILPQLLGDGPLVASLSADVVPGRTLVRLGSAHYGEGEMHGLARLSAGAWNGAAAGHVGPLRLGLRLKDDSLGVQPLIGDDWLDAELTRAGIAVASRHSEIKCPACRLPSAPASGPALPRSGRK
jgi:hypothetical protein